MLDFFAAIADASTYRAQSFAPERPRGPLRVLQMSALKEVGSLQSAWLQTRRVQLAGI
jgi:hypothetical protein